MQNFTPVEIIFTRLASGKRVQFDQMYQSKCICGCVKGFNIR